jgi:hypothetical protein
MMVEYQRERRRGRTLGGRQRKGHERGCNDLSGHRGFTNNRDSKTFWSFKQVAATLQEGRTTGRSSQHHKKQEMTIRSMAAVQIKTDKDKLNLTTGTLIPIGFSSLFSESLFTGAYERFSMYQ